MTTIFHQKAPWVSTEEMAEFIGIHPKTLLGLRRKENCPFVEGKHYRRKGSTTNSPLQWHPEKTEEAFTSFKRTDPSKLETYRGRNTSLIEG